ncbi:MAG: beta-lactamase family protein [Alphaproteobacteria bacterium]|nr:beta-lactamase family protein [Alphaproteobacteria bacterium]
MTPVAARAAWRGTAVAIASLLAAATPSRAQTGAALPGTQPFDAVMAAFMAKWRLPSGALVVAAEGRLIYARGFGEAEPGTPATPATLFRVASLSKPLTAMAALRLVEEGRLDLDARVLPILAERFGAALPADPRWAAITLRHLLSHRGGWDRDAAQDPTFLTRARATAGPPGCASTIAFMFGEPLQFDPGSRFAYSDFGYCVAEAVIEARGGDSYEAVVRRLVLVPTGAVRLTIARGDRAGRRVGEALYHAEPGDERPEDPYAFAPIAAAHGWIAAPVDLLRAILAAPTLLQPASVAAMARPTGPVDDAGTTMGLGLFQRPLGDGVMLFHDGSLPGTTALLATPKPGTAWVAVFTVRLHDRGRRQRLRRAIDEALWKAYRAMGAVPEGDLFGRF